MVVYLIAISCILGFICLLTGVTGLIALLSVKPSPVMAQVTDMGARKRLILLLLSTGFLLLADVGAHLMEGSFDPLQYRGFCICVVLDHLLAFLSLVCYTGYVSHLVGLTPMVCLMRNAVYAVAAGLSLVAVTAFRNGFLFTMDDSHYYRPGPGFRYAVMMFVFAILLAYFMSYFGDRNLLRSRQIILSQYVIFPILFILQQQIFFVRMQTPNIGLGMAVLFQSIVSGLGRRQLIIQQQEVLIRQQERLIHQEQELTHMRIRSAVSQMQPHFVFNVLNSIYVLIDQDTEAAKTAVSSFSDYLRGIISAMENQRLIAFSQELDYIQKYLTLEQIRYGEEELKIVYDLKVTGFRVPPLSVQPLVENAVKHGVGKKPDGGTIRISTEEAKKAIRIIIEDDGVGFDPEILSGEQEETGEKTERPIGIGLKNARRRFRLIQNADLSVRSAPGQGTTVTVTIPEQV